MLHVTILGPDCGKCVRLESMVIETLQGLGVTDASVQKVADQRLIKRYLHEDPPGLLINNRLYWGGGNLPTSHQLTAWLQSEADTLISP